MAHLLTQDPNCAKVTTLDTYSQIHMALHLSLEAQLTEIGSALS